MSISAKTIPNKEVFAGSRVIEVSPYSDADKGQPIISYKFKIQNINSVVAQKAQPRFTCNTYIQDREKAYDVIKNFASVFRALNFWIGGRIMTVGDRPDTVTAIFTNANVKEGEFNYSSTSKKARYNIVKVRYNNPENFYETDLVQVEDIDSIIRYGMREKEITAFACTSKYEAERLGKYIMYTENNLTEVVTFETGLEANAVFPGAVIKIHDNNRNKVFQGGRIRFHSGNSITLDRKVHLGEVWEDDKQYFENHVCYEVVGSFVNYYQSKYVHKSLLANKFANSIWKKIGTLFSSEIDYFVGDIVYIHQGGTTYNYYECIQDSTGIVATNASYWKSVESPFKLYVTDPKDLMQVSEVLTSDQAEDIFKDQTKAFQIHPAEITGEAEVVIVSESTDLLDLINKTWIAEPKLMNKSKEWRVLGIEEKEDGSYSMECIEYNSEIFKMIEDYHIDYGAEMIETVNNP